MRLHRLSGAIMGLLAGIFVSFLLSASAVQVLGEYAAGYRPLFFIMAIPMTVMGAVFDTKRVRKTLSLIIHPGYIYAAIYWMLGFPFVKITNDLILAVYFPLFSGAGFEWPAYLTSWGANGIIGYIFYQAMVGILFGVGFYMGYERIFKALHSLDQRYLEPRRAQ